MSAAAKGRSRRRRIWFALIAIGAGCLTAAVLGELALRIAGYDRVYFNPHQAFFRPDERIGYIGKKDFEGRFKTREFDVHVAHDERGFRRVDVEQDGRDHRLLVFGDSFAWGWGVSQGEVVTDHLARLMPDHEVINFGISGTGTVQQFLLFEELGAPLLRAGDTLLLLFFGNDWDDNVHGRVRARVEEGEVVLGDEVRQLGADVFSRTKNWLKDRSYLVNFVIHSVDHLKARIHDPRGETIADVEKGRPCRVAAEHFLDRFRDACGERGARFVVAWVPGQAEIGESSEPPESREFEAVWRRAFFEMTGELELETIDLRPYLMAPKSADSDLRMTFPNDEHWNAAGHVVAAEAIAEHLTRRD